MIKFSFLIILYSSSVQAGMRNLAHWIYRESSAAQCLAFFESTTTTTNLSRSTIAQTFKQWRDNTLPAANTSSYAEPVIAMGDISLTKQLLVSERLAAVEQVLLTDNTRVSQVTKTGSAAISNFFSTLRVRQLELEKDASQSEISMKRLLAVKTLSMSVIAPTAAIGLNYFLYFAPPSMPWIKLAVVSGACLYLSIHFFGAILVDLDHSILKLKSFAEKFLSGQQSWGYWSQDVGLPQLFLDVLVERGVITPVELAHVMYYQRQDELERLFNWSDPLNARGFYLIDVLFRRVWDHKQQEVVPEMTLVLRSSYRNWQFAPPTIETYKALESVKVHSE